MKRACIRCGKLDCTEHKPKPFASSQARRKVTGAKRKRRNQRLLLHHGSICHICGKPGATEIDHVTPLAAGGTDEFTNLAPAHVDCHKAKTSFEASQREPIVVPPTRPGFVLVIVGPPASGKSWLATRVSQRLGWDYRSIDDCGERGQYGKRWGEMLHWLATKVGKSVITESNLVPPEYARFLSGCDHTTVAISAPTDIREKRMKERGWADHRLHSPLYPVDLTVPGDDAGVDLVLTHMGGG